MLFELSVTPLGAGPHISGPLAEVLKIIDSSGLPYQLAPTGTTIEGEWDEVMPVIRKCHERTRQDSPHVITTIKIEDEEGEREKLRRNVASVEEKAGRPLHTAPA